MNPKILPAARLAYREYVLIAFLYRRHSMTAVELRNLTSTRNWRVF
jgi:hypothetical protein